MAIPEGTQYEVKAVDYHRNGIGGVGFVIAIVRDTGTDADRLYIDFDIDGEEGNTYAAVVDLAQAAKGNIYMHPHTEGQGPGPSQPGMVAFRGDVLAEAIRPLVQRALKETRDSRDVAQFGRVLR